ncbi:hypothetical protein RB200_25270 [Streptomyces sp. PmtG]
MTNWRSSRRPWAPRSKAWDLAVHASRVGYDNLEDDIRARMRALNAEAEKYYAVERDPYARRERSTETGKQDANGTEGL